MKSALFTFALVLCLSASAAVTTTTNFVGTVCTRQQLLAMTMPEVEVSWETNILQDTAGDASVYYVGQHCDVLIANWLAASTTNAFCTYSNEDFRVNGQMSKFRLNYDGTWGLGGVEDWTNGETSGSEVPKIEILEQSKSLDRIYTKWRYYRWNNTNGDWKYREFTMALTVRPKWRFQLPAATP